VLPSAMRPRSRRAAAGIAVSAAVLLGATDVLPQRVAEVSREVEQVRGRHFAKPVAASEIDAAEAKQMIRQKIVDGLPVVPEDWLQTLIALGLVDERPGLLDRLVDFYSSQVIAFYDPQPRRFFVVRGAEGMAAIGGAETMTEGLVFSHELMHALQDESMQLDRRIQELKEDGDRSLALQCLLEGEATIVMVRVALLGIPGADETAEEQIAPLLSAGALERANVPADVPAYFVDQLFFPYVEGTAYVRAALKRGGWPEVDRLWRAPPESTAEILHQETLPPPARGLLPADVATAFPGRRLLYTDTLGEWTIRFLLGRSLPQEEAARAATGWRGDRIAFFSEGRATGYLWRIRFDGPGTAERFADAFRRARSARPVRASETVERTGHDVVVTAGIPKARPPA
jgi:hypothetical protein